MVAFVAVDTLRNSTFPGWTILSKWLPWSIWSLFGHFWGRPTECLWSTSSERLGVVLQSVAHHRKCTWLGTHQIFYSHGLPFWVVFASALCRCLACLSTQGPPCQALCHASGFSGTCKDNWDGTDRVSLHASGGQFMSHWHIKNDEDHGSGDFYLGFNADSHPFLNWWMESSKT